MESDSSTGAAATPPPAVVLDSVGIFWLVFAIAWTCILVAGMSFLYTKRDMPLLRMRSLYLSFSGVILLHLYWLAVQLGYLYGHLMPAAIEFWIMSLYLPFGIALFQASNYQFLYVSQAQKTFVRPGTATRRRANVPSGLRCFMGRLKRLDYSSRMLLYISIGMVMQLLVTITMFLVSRKFHSTWGIPGTEVSGTEQEQKMQQGRGWEWWPSLFWQFFWAWLIAPIILWRARRVHDTHGWRLQTMACCIAGLHASPMWLVALYVPAMAPVNRYFIPPQWIAVSIMILEIFTILLPCWQVIRHQSMRQETLDTIAAWEARNKGTWSPGSSAYTKGSDAVSDSWMTLVGEREGSIHSQAGSLLTMGALEYVLDKNPEPLRQFSALKDFSGENIAFLTNVAEWKRSIAPSARRSSLEKEDPAAAEIPLELVRDRFNSALRIYDDFVSPRLAEFPINISSPELRKLEAVFEKAARILYGSEGVAHPVSPFEGADPWSKERLPSSASESTKPGSSATAVEVAPCQELPAQPAIDGVLFWGDIPDGFDAAVFDEAEKSIKYLVLTNTWPKFVIDRRGSMESSRSDTTQSHQA